MWYVVCGMNVLLVFPLFQFIRVFEVLFSSDWYCVVAIYFQFVKTSSYTLGSIHLLKIMEDIQMGTNSNYNHNQTPSTPVDYFWAAHTNQKTQFLPVQHQNNQSSAFNSSFSNHFQHGQGSAFSPTGVSFSNTPSPLLHVGVGGSTPEALAVRAVPPPP